MNLQNSIDISSWYQSLSERVLSDHLLKVSHAVVEGLTQEYFAIYSIAQDASVYVYRSESAIADQLSDAFERTGNYETAIRDYIKNYVHPEDRGWMFEEFGLEHIYRSLMAEQTLSFTYRRNDGDRTEYLQAVYMPVPCGQEIPEVIMAVRDLGVVIHRELEQKHMMEETLAQVKQASRKKAAFFSNMSHDMRTPLNVLIGYATVAAGHMEDREMLKDALHNILLSSQHLLSLVNDVLDMSRMENGKMSLKEKACDLVEVLKGFSKLVQAPMADKRICWEMDLSGIRDRKVFADTARLHRILLNIVDNAIKYTMAGGRIRLTVSQEHQRQTDYARYEIQIADTGMGISEEFLPHIFEAFEREQTEAVSGIEGTGLGLAITKNLVEMMGGQIFMESKPGKGSVCTIILRLRLQDAENGEKFEKSAR